MSCHNVCSLFALLLGSLCPRQYCLCVCIIEGTAWTDEKQRWEESEKRREEKKEDQKRESLRRKKIQVREKVGKSRHTVFFQWFVAPEAH